jgi:hypothetical protein
MEKATAAGEEVIRQFEDTVEDSYSRTARTGIEYAQTILAIAHANADAYFDWAREVVRVSSPIEFIAVSATCAQKYCQNWGQQTRELVALAQKATAGNIGPAGVIIGGALLGRHDLS